MTVDASNVTVSTIYTDPVTRETVTVVDGDEVSRVPPTPEQSAAYAQADALAQLEGAVAVAAVQAGPMVKSGELTDRELTALAPLFPAWAPGLAVAVGDLYSYGSDVVECLQAHTTQADWTPPATPALWRVHRGAGEVEPWTQPDSTNPYMRGDRVTFEGGTYSSTIDHNVWSPAGYPPGWELVE